MRPIALAALFTSLTLTAAVRAETPAGPTGDAASSAAVTTPAPTPPARTEGEVPATVSFVYPLATNFGQPRVATWFDLSLVYGQVGGVRAFQLGAGAVYASAYARGAQIAAAAAATGDLHGVQIAGAVTVAREVRGAQIAGGAAVAGDVAGAQIGVVNVAGEVRGAEIGVVNVAHRVKGAQVGVVNVAEDVDGAAIGLVTITKGGVHPLAWASNLAYGNVGVKFSTRHVYSLLAAQLGSLETAGEPRFGVTYGLGLHLPLVSKLDMDVEVALSHVAVERVGARPTNTWAHARALPGWSFAPHFRLFAGAGFRAPLEVDLGRSVVRPEIMAGLQL